MAIIYGFLSGAFVCLIGPALITLADDLNEIGIRLGMGFLVVSWAALSGSPITGAQLDIMSFTRQPYGRVSASCPARRCQCRRRPLVPSQGHVESSDGTRSCIEVTNLCDGI